MRLSYSLDWKFAHCFNPRICKRCDTALFGTIERIGVSIHASVKDATGIGSAYVRAYKFQSTHL